MSERDLVIPMLIATGHHLKRIETHLGLKKMTPKERTLYMKVEAGEVPHFKKLLHQGRGIMAEGGNFFDFLGDAVSGVAGALMPGTDKLVDKLIGRGYEIGGNDDDGGDYHIGGDDGGDYHIGGEYEIGGDEEENHAGAGFFDDVWDGIKTVGNIAAPIAIPFATKALLGAGGKVNKNGYTSMKKITQQKNKNLLDINHQGLKPGARVKIGKQNMIMTAQGLVPDIAAGDYVLQSNTRSKTGHIGGALKIAGNGSTKKVKRNVKGGAYIDENGNYVNVKPGLLGSTYINPLEHAI